MLRGSPRAAGRSAATHGRTGRPAGARAGRAPPGRGRRAPPPPARAARSRRRARRDRRCRRRSGAAGSGVMPEAPIVAGTSITWSSGRNGQRAVVADVDHLDVAAVGGERGEQVDRGLGVERAAAPLERRRLGVDRRVGVEREQLVLDGGHGVRARHRTGRRSARAARRRARSSSAGSTTGRRRAARPATAGSSTSSAISGSREASSPGSRSTPSTDAPRTQVRWLSPT